MKNAHKMLAIVVVAIVVVAGYFVITAEADEWTVPWSDNTVFDGEWKTKLQVVFEDGTTKSFEDIQNGDTLTVYHEGSVVTGVQWWLEAKATTPVGTEPWDQCEIDMSMVSLSTDIDTIPVGEQPPVNMFTKTDTFGALGYYTINIGTMLYQTVCGAGLLNLDFITDGFGADFYMISFTPSGNVNYRGVGIYYPDVNPNDHGSWVLITPPPALSFQIEVRNTQDVTVDFDANVIWS